MLQSANRSESEADWGPIAFAAEMRASWLRTPNVKAFSMGFEPLFAVELVTWARRLRELRHLLNSATESALK